MDRLDAELVLFRWDQAGDEDRLEAARYGVRELTAELDRLEAEAPVIAEKVCAGSARVRDFPALAQAYQCGEAALSWARTCPDLVTEWERLQSRVLAVMTALRALDPACRWSPPTTNERTG
jgi:hypothetical protein